MIVDREDDRPAVTRESREWVDQVLVDLAAEWGSFRVREQHWELDETSYEAFRRRYEAGHSGGAGVWVQHDGSVLMVRHEGETAWSEPGGKVDPGESFAEAARRETEEETGVTVSLTGILEVHPVVHVGPGNRPPVVSPIVVFTGRYESGTPEGRAGEIAAARWQSERPSDLLYDALEAYPFSG
jgi:8-oxo-dGTP diphosphatase